MHENEKAQEQQAIMMITLLRIYDVLMAQLAVDNPNAAQRLEEIHAQGQLAAVEPLLSSEPFLEEQE